MLTKYQVSVPHELNPATASSGSNERQPHAAGNQPWCFRRFWDGLGDGISGHVRSGFFNLGFWVAENPWKTIAITCVIVLISACGLFNARIERDPKQMWASEKTNFLRDVHWLKATFKEDNRVENALITAPNVLTPIVFAKLLYITQQINSLRVVHSSQIQHLIAWQDVCLKVPLLSQFSSSDQNIPRTIDWDESNRTKSSKERPPTASADKEQGFSFFDSLICSFATNVPRGCLISSVLDLWEYDEAEIQTLTSDDILEAVNEGMQLTASGSEFDLEKVLGGIERDSSGKITKATGLLISWVTYVNYSSVDLGKNGNAAGTEDWITEDTYLWEEGFLNRMEELKKQLDNQNLRIDYAAGRSFGDITNKATFQGFDMVHVSSALMFFYMHFVLSKFSWVEIRVLLSCFGLFGIGMSIIIAFGLYSALGWSFNLTQCSVPYVAMGLGIDDIFVMMISLRKIQIDFPGATLPQQIALMLQHAGAAITVTSITDIAAFGIGLASSFPGMRMFCLLGAISVLTTYAVVISFFVAVLTLDERRVSARRNGIFPWVVHSETDSKLWCNPRLMERFITAFYGKIVMTTTGKTIIIGLTLAITGWSAVSFPKLQSKYDPNWHLTKGSYCREYLEQFAHTFSNSGTQAFVFLGELNYAADFQSLILLSEKLNSKNDIIQELKPWPIHFQQYLKNMRNTDQFEFLENEFNVYLSKFLFTLEGSQFQKNFKFAKPLKCRKAAPRIIASSIEFEFKSLKEPEEYLPAKAIIEKIVRELPLTSIDAFRTVWSKVFIYWEADEAMGSEMYRNVALTLLTVMACAALVLLNLQHCLWIFVCDLITIINVGGFLRVWGVTLSLTTTLAIQIAIGFSVDYASHVSQTFLITSGQSRQQRAFDTVLHIGPAVFYGGCTTFLSVSMLSFTGLYSYILFARVFFLFVLFGLFTGLVLLPVILSLVGPEAKSSTDKLGTGAIRQVAEGATTWQGVTSQAYQPE